MTENSRSASTESEESINSKKKFPHRISREHIKSRYGDLIDSLPLIVYIVEPHSPYFPIYISKGIEMLGYTQNDWHNTPNLWIDLIHEDDRERVLKETRKAFADQSETDYEYRMRSRDGSVYWFHDKGNFLRDENGEPISWEGFLLDITKRKSAETDEQNTNGRIDKSAAENKTKSILLVEDEKIIREMMREILSGDGYDVTTAVNGVEALEICETGDKSFDLLITDFEMPQMNGRELAEKIKASCDDAKILFVSGYAGDDDFLRNLSINGKYFVAKPFSPDSFTAKVKAILEED